MIFWRFGAMDLKAGEITAQKIMCNELVILQKGECNQLRCDQFQFNQALGNHIRLAGLAECAHLKAAQAECQAMAITNPEGKPVLVAGTDTNTQAGFIQTMRTNGVPLVQIRATDAGGMVTTVGHSGRVLVAMGHEAQNFGVFAQFPQVGPPFPLTSPWRVQTKTTTPKPSKTTEPITPSEQTIPQSNQPSASPATTPPTPPGKEKTP